MLSWATAVLPEESDPEREDLCMRVFGDAIVIIWLFEDGFYGKSSTFLSLRHGFFHLSRPICHGSQPVSSPNPWWSWQLSEVTLSFLWLRLQAPKGTLHYTGSQKGQQRECAVRLNTPVSNCKKWPPLLALLSL